MNRSEQINELAAALAKAQAKIEAAPKDNTAKVKGRTRDGRDIEYSYSYSTLADVWAACRAPLSENGLAVVQTVVAKGQAVTVTTLLAHSSGQWISEELTMTAADEKPQSVGSAITYARRYALGAIVGVVSEEDDDGAAATHGRQNGNGATRAPQRQAANGKQATQSTNGTVKAASVAASIWERIQEMATEYEFPRGEKDADLIALVKKVSGGKPGKDLTEADFVAVEAAMAAEMIGGKPQGDIAF